MAALLAAPLFLDILWPIFLLLGWEQARVDPGNTRFTPLDLYNFPWSHSLLKSIVWATTLALIYHQLARGRWTSRGFGAISRPALARTGESYALAWIGNFTRARFVLSLTGLGRGCAGGGERGGNREGSCLKSRRRLRKAV